MYSKIKLLRDNLKVKIYTRINEEKIVYPNIIIIYYNSYLIKLICLQHSTTIIISIELILQCKE